MSGPRGLPLDWIQAARSAQLGEITDVADWYEQARITVDADDAGIRVIRVSGDVAAATAAYLNVVLEHEIATRPPELVLDLSGATFIGVRGIATLLRAADSARRQALCLRLVLGEHPEVTRILQRTGAARMLQVCGPLEAGRGHRPPLDATEPGSVPATRSAAPWPVPDGPGRPGVGSALSVAVERHPDHALITVRGELGLNGAGAVTQALTELLLDPGHLVVDLSQLRIGAIAALQVFPSALAATGGWPLARLVLFAAAPELAQVLHGVGVTDTVPLAPDHAAALTRLDLRPRRLTRYHVLEPHLGSPWRARALLRRACRDWALGNASDGAALVVTELVTNAVRHAGTPCRLDITSDEHGLRIAVRDQSPLPTPLLDGSHLMNRGVGLRVVATLAHEWGVLPHTDGKTVWALFPSR
jgi:anti-anti-sigma factor